MNKATEVLLKQYHTISTLNVKDRGVDLDSEVKAAGPRDYQYADHFEADVFGAVLPSTFLRTLNQLPRFPFQNSILSCVSSTCTFINSYNSKKEGNDVFLGWRYPYSQVPHYAGGTSVRDNLNILKKKGQCENNFLPEDKYFLGERAMQNPKYISHDAHRNAKAYKIKAYYFLKTWSEVEMKSAILNAPIGIGLWVGYNWYRTPTSQPIQFDGHKRFGHLVSIVGWTEKGWLMADWDGRGIKLLSYKYPLSLAFAIRDLSDKLKGKSMKPYKLENTSRLLVILPNGKYQFISSPTQWRALNEKGLLLGATQIMKEEDLKKLTLDEEPIIVAK